MAFSPDGKNIVTTDVNAVRIWDAESGRELQKFVPAVLYSDIEPILKPLYGDKTKIVRSDNVSVNEDGSFRITSSMSSVRTVRVFDAESGEELQKFEYELSVRFKYAAFSSDGKKLVAVSDDTMRIFDVESGKELQKWTWEVSYWKGVKSER